MLNVGQIVNGKYQITGIVGHGGMGCVYSATNLPDGRKLAVKVAIRNGRDNAQTAVQGLAAEGELLKALDNPHLPHIYDIIENESEIMIVMEFIEGVNLNDYLRDNGAMSPAQVIDCGIQVCEVFHYLHTQNPPIIYRDMKPANLMMQPDGKIMMLDFGTARTWKIDTSRTSDTMLIGTEGFAAPEQFGGLGQSDARTDIFCLGATLFNLVTGHSPYIKPFGITPLGDWDESLAKHPLDAIIQKCTARDPYERYQTASELEADLVYVRDSGKSGRTGFLNLLKRPKKNDGFQKVNITEATNYSGDLSGKSPVPSGNSPEFVQVSLQTPQEVELKVNPVQEEVYEAPETAEADHGLLWKVLAIAGGIVAVLMVILTVVSLLGGITVLAVICGFIGFLAIVLAVVSAVLLLKSVNAACRE